MQLAKLSALAPEAAQLPELRADLQIFHGPFDGEGRPTFTVYDPLNRTYDKIGWEEAEVLERMRKPHTAGELAALLERDTTLRVTPQELLEFAEEMKKRGFTRESLFRKVDDLLEEGAAKKQHPLKWLLTRYIYTRIPLLDPDDFLERALPYVRFIGSPVALALYAVLLVVGLSRAALNAEEFLTTFSYFFNTSGFLAFGVALVGVKAIHEFSHAFTAKHFGCRVPTIGVAFVIMWPLAYCDVTDAWRLKERWKRLAISSAGVASELAIAGLALFIWGFLEPGVLKSVCFLLSSSSLLSTLLVNINPGMRYDGYYILMDIMREDNLQRRAFAYTKHLYRKVFLGIETAHPEPDLRRKKLAGMAIYTCYAWLYRLGLYISISLVIYYRFAKVLGAILLVVALWMFLISPLLKEVKMVWSLRERLTRPLRPALTGLAVLALAAWFIAPMPRRFSLPAVVESGNSQVLYVPRAGEVTTLGVARDDSVQEAQLVIDVHSYELDQELEVLRSKLAIIEARIDRASLNQEAKAYLPQLREEAQALRSRIMGLQNQREQMRLYAEVSGRVYTLEETLREGVFVRQNEVLGKIADPDDLEVYAYVEESRAADIRPGDKARFQDARTAELHPMEVTSVSPVRAYAVEHVGLTSLSGGELPAVKREERIVLMESFYKVRLKPSNPEALRTLGQLGKVWLETQPRSLAVEWARKAHSVVLRESNF